MAVVGGEIELVGVDDDEVCFLHTREDHCRLSREDVHVVRIGLEPRPQGHIVGEREQGVWESVVVPGLLWDAGGGKGGGHAGAGSGASASASAAAAGNTCVAPDSVAGPAALRGPVLLPASILRLLIVVGD